MFLTPENLVELTDRKRPADQITWLRERGYRFEVSATGRPKVMIEEARNHMVGRGKHEKSTGSAPRLELVK